MKELLITSYSFNLRYAWELVAEVNDNMMAYSPNDGLENHPAFTIGYLVSAAALPQNI